MTAQVRTSAYLLVETVVCYTYTYDGPVLKEGLPCDNLRGRLWCILLSEADVDATQRRCNRNCAVAEEASLISNALEFHNLMAMTYFCCELCKH